MRNEKDETKSVWNDISKIWKRIASVIGAVELIATFLIKMFHISPELTYCSFTALGIVLLIISFYVDKQSEYTHQEILKHEKEIKEECMLAINETREIAKQNIENNAKKISGVKEDIKELINITQETRKDTLRIQLLMILEQQPENIDTILKLAETYFVKLHGDWYMTSEFNKWAKAHDVIVPSNIYKAIDDTHKER